MKDLENLQAEIRKVMIGKEKEVELFVISLLFNGHILMESVPGTGKTMLAKTFANTMNGAFSRIQFTPDVLPSDVTGIQFFNPKKQEFEFKPGPIIANVVLADEINRATPRTQSSLLEVMEEKQVTIDGHTIPVSDPFMVIATQNPVESQQGTFPLPVAQLDRFFMKLSMRYPTFEEEREMLQISRRGNQAKEVSAIVTSVDIEKMRNQVKEISVNDEVESYLLQIVRKTREHPSIELGVSPRGALALMKAAQGKAFLEGRTYVIPNDIKEMIPYVLSHRIFLTTEGSLTKTPEKVLEEVIESVPVPVEAGA
ncbi:AAA family ATPase [Cytobacillus solani]|uniref:Magnesium chelatase n=1 Tax=Cytobacillus solani TaxID=1637975 RepID=A0A0Q3VGL6_9BACI|nr:MoxR family ATPase [Cytobacillus solani]KQL18898.1 magnesium chelatase [Cytobacillus solani]USK56816.1 MoxR family ATPase [Cytobacillus solani]